MPQAIGARRGARKKAGIASSTPSRFPAPYRDAARRIVGVIGVVGPMRLNYARVVPVVDYTAEAISRVLAERGA